MAIFVVARILDPKNEIGFRILDTKTQTASNVSYASMLDVLKKGKTKIENVKLSDGKVVGTNGSLERYAAEDLNGTLLKGKRPIVVLAQIGDTHYDLSDHKGTVLRHTVEEALKSAGMRGVANGKVVTKDGKSFISAISGTYPAANLPKTGNKQVPVKVAAPPYATLADCCTVELLPHGIIMRVKAEVPMDALLRFKGFNGKESLFKYDGDFEKYGDHNMLVVGRDEQRLGYSWGQSTTMASQNLWDRNRVILEAMEKLTQRKIYCTK